MAELNPVSIPRQEPKTLTARSMIASLVIIAVSVWWDEWMSYDMSGSNISRSHFPLAFLLPYLLLCTMNLLVGRVRPALALQKPELLVVLATGLVAISVPYDGLTGQLIGLIAGAFYFATAETGGACMSTITSPHGWFHRTVRARWRGSTKGYRLVRLRI